MKFLCGLICGLLLALASTDVATAQAGNDALRQKIDKKFGECKTKLGDYFLGVALTKKNKLECIKSKSATQAIELLKSGDAECNKTGHRIKGVFDNKGKITWHCAREG